MLRTVIGGAAGKTAGGLWCKAIVRLGRRRLQAFDEEAWVPATGRATAVRIPAMAIPIAFALKTFLGAAAEAVTR
jgi:hypothetical protein